MRALGTLATAAGLLLGAAIDQMTHGHATQLTGALAGAGMVTLGAWLTLEVFGQLESRRHADDTPNDPD